MASGAAQHDLPAAKRILENHLVLQHGRLYADKDYTDVAWAESLKKNHALELLTPRKKCKGDVQISSDIFIMKTFPQEGTAKQPAPKGRQ